MPWRDKTVEELRKEFVEAAKTTNNFSSLCREFGISRKTGYKWVERNNQSCSMTDRSHAPVHIPGRTPIEIERAILQVRADNPEWGAKTILKVLENNGYEKLPCVRTANNILQRNGCISESESQKREAFLRFQREHCNELWQIDFKGDFPLLNGTRCYPFDILDDCSRFCIGLFAKGNTKGITKDMEQVFREYGLPKAILSDNGEQFAGLRGGFTHFEKWLMDLDILPIHGRPLHPQTQGKIERFHRTMKNELLKRNMFFDLADADKHLTEWRTNGRCNVFFFNHYIVHILGIGIVGRHCIHVHRHIAVRIHTVAGIQTNGIHICIVFMLCSVGLCNRGIGFGLQEAALTGIAVSKHDHNTHPIAIMGIGFKNLVGHFHTEAGAGSTVGAQALSSFDQTGVCAAGAVSAHRNRNQRILIHT